MGKDLKGKELGIGISQLADGRYTARLTCRNGKRIQKYFKKLQECRNWLADARYNDEHGSISSRESMTVDAWFDYWMNQIKGNNIRPNTIASYNNRYRENIKEYIGNMIIGNVKPLHCQNILNRMSGKYTTKSIRQTRMVLYILFQSAVDNEIIIKNPVIKSVKCVSDKAEYPTRVMTVEEQKTFLLGAKMAKNYNQYAFILQTGLRTGEMIGLQWDDIDFDNRIVHIRRTMGKIHSEWVSGNPKSQSGIRDIPLTDEACKILLSQKKKDGENKMIEIEFGKYVFLSSKGKLLCNATYDTNLEYLSKKLGISHLSMHTLRHTFATRCIESGMNPKTLQKILGHSSIGITMDLYVHVTEDEKRKEMEEIERSLKLV